jgi:ClpP class serine protease
MSDILNIIWIILLLEHQTPERAEELAKMFSEGRWTHDCPVSYEEAKEMGLPVKEQMPEDIYQLMELYPQAKQQRPGVEFIPVPYRSPTAPGKGEK